MKSLLKILLIGLVIFASTSYASRALAEIKFNNIEIYDIKNGMAKLKWTTDQPTKAIVYFGDNPDNLDRNVGYSLYDYHHESVLTGLQKNKTYYYKITATDQLGSKTESFVQTFSTKGMVGLETVKPVFEEQKILQIINDAVALSWTTDEETNAVIHYSDEPGNLNKAVRYKSFDRQHELLVHGLKPETKYYMEITAEDRSGNQSSKFFIFYTPDRTKTVPDLIISDIEPLSFDKEIILSRRIAIKWKTNLVAKSTIHYGDKPGKYTKKISIAEPRQLNHQFILDDLEPNTTYYYKITAHDSFHKKTATTKEMSFTTAPLQKKFIDGSLVKGSGYKVYVISGNNRRWIETAEIFAGLGYRWGWIQTIGDSLLNEYLEESSIKNTKSHPDGTLVKYADSAAVYLIENGKKRPFSSAEAFIRKGYNWDKIIIIPKGEKYKDGEYL